MRAALVTSRAALGAVIAAAAVSGVAPAAGAQVTRRDTSRTIIIDSVTKTYGDPGAARARTADRGGPDLARTIDAEIRVAMFELASGEELPALDRLQRLSTLVGQDSSGAAAPERAALHFLLAQSYYRLGMLAPFRREAEASLAAASSRYAPLLRPQLVVEAYRTGDYARAATLARDLPAADQSGLGALVAGLAAYQSGDLPAARSAFQRAAGGGGQFATYAKYMDAIAQLRSDSAHTTNAVASLESVASSATGPFADQVRLTAAQVAYEGENYADAVRMVSAISDGSQVAAPALLTRAWALYKLDRVDEAQRAFSDFATRYANRPERDEAQLMAAQAQLELGRSSDAETIFQRVADSSLADVSLLQAQTNAAIADLSRALVTDRAADLLIIGDPATAKAVALRDSSDAQAVLAVVTGSGTPSSTVITEPSVVSSSASSRLDSIAARATPGVRRVLFAPASATRQPGELAVRSQNLAGADAAVAVSRHRLAEQLEAQQREMALLARLGASLSADSAAIGGLAAEYQTLVDSMARLDQLMAAAEARLRAMLGREVEATRTLAAENARTADSLRTALAGGASPEDRAAIDAEVATAATYARIADMAASGLDRAIAHHPAFALRDSLRAHGTQAKALLAELQGSYSGSRRDIDAALTALRGGDGPAVRAARQALAEAEARRTSVEGEAIAAVTAELSARATEMAAGLQRNGEAAQFGVASAAFFRAIDGTRAVGDGGSPGNRAGTATDLAAPVPAAPATRAAGNGGSTGTSAKAGAPRNTTPERRR
jgi:hypothetical protein